MLLSVLLFIDGSLEVMGQCFVAGLQSHQPGLDVAEFILDIENGFGIVLAGICGIFNCYNTLVREICRDHHILWKAPLSIGTGTIGPLEVWTIGGGFDTCFPFPLLRAGSSSVSEPRSMGVNLATAFALPIVLEGGSDSSAELGTMAGVFWTFFVFEGPATAGADIFETLPASGTGLILSTGLVAFFPLPFFPPPVLSKCLLSFCMSSQLASVLPHFCFATAHSKQDPRGEGPPCRQHSNFSSSQYEHFFVFVFVPRMAGALSFLRPPLTTTLTLLERGSLSSLRSACGGAALASAAASAARYTSLVRFLRAASLTVSCAGVITLGLLTTTSLVVPGGGGSVAEDLAGGG